MAYRDFPYEEQYASPDTSQAFQNQMQGLTNLFRGLQQKQEQRRKASDQFAYDLDGGAFENDTKILGEVAKNVTDRAKNEYRQNGRLSPETQELMINGKTWQQQSKNQLDRAKALNSQITSKSDPYYNPEPDLNLVKWATHGENNDVDFRSRAERLAEAEKQLGGSGTFKFDKYRADYVKTEGQQSKEREFPMRNGSSKTVYDQATFWDDKTGKPGVTDGHAIRFIESDRRVSQFYDDKVNSELDQEIKAMKSSGDERTSWMKGMNEAEIKNELINNPTKNLVNQKDYGVRVRDLAKKDLNDSDKINSKISYTGLQSDTNSSGGRWKNPNILHDDAFNTVAQEAKNADGTMSTAVSYGPGGRFTQKSGKAVQLDTTNPIRTNIKTGITTRDAKGSLRLNMTGYQLMPVRAGMAPFALKSSSPQEMIEEINQIPLEHFNPNGKMKLQPEMRIGLNGYVINEAGVLNDVQDELVSLSRQIQDATAKKDDAKFQALQNLEMNLNDLKEMVGAGDYDAQELILAGNKAGVRKIQQDMIIPADNSDLAAINNVTGGFDLRKKDYWSDDMKNVADAYSKRAQEAKSKGYGAEEKPKEKKISSEEFNTQWATLKSGQKLIGPDGKTYIKK